MRNAIEDRLQVRIYIFIFNFFSIEFFGGVRRSGPWTGPGGGPWTQSVGLVHGPGVSVFGSPDKGKTSKQNGLQRPISSVILLITNGVVL